jgi:hypothetical protein
MITGDNVSKRVLVTLPDHLHAALEQWAEEETRPTANLAAFLLEQAIRAKYPERYPSAQTSKETR